MSKFWKRQVASSTYFSPVGSKPEQVSHGRLCGALHEVVAGQGRDKQKKTSKIRFILNTNVLIIAETIDTDTLSRDAGCTETRIPMYTDEEKKPAVDG